MPVKNLSECFICLIKLSFYSSPSLGLLLFAGTCGAEELCHSPFCPLMPPFPPCVSLCVSAPTPPPTPNLIRCRSSLKSPSHPMLGTKVAHCQPNDCLDCTTCQLVCLLHHRNMDSVSHSAWVLYAVTFKCVT